MLFLSLLIDQIFLYKSDSLLLDVNIIIQALSLHSLLPIKKYTSNIICFSLTQ